jgi:hypothetical protein
MLIRRSQASVGAVMASSGTSGGVASQLRGAVRVPFFTSYSAYRDAVKSGAGCSAARAPADA